MRRFWEITKRQRDKERRLQQNDPGKQTVFYETPEGEQAYITPTQPVATEPTPPPDPEVPSDYVRIVQKFFVNETVWNFEHGLGNTPVLAVWKGTVNIYGYGTQPYGTSPYGGGTFTENFVLATHEPETTEVDEDNITVDWGLEGDTSGKVVAVG